MASPELLQHAQHHFAHRLRASLPELLQPLPGSHPAGNAVKGSGVLQAILNARRADAAHLPLGPWQHELKRADWDAVAALACDALQRHGKDLQLAAWLLEAEIHRSGFAGLAPCLVLMEELLLRFGADLHPQDDDGGAEHRANVLRWMNRKLLAPLKQLPLTATGDAEFGWADREVAWRNEQHKPERGDAGEGPPLQAVSDAMARTPSEHHLALHRELRLALGALDALGQAVDGAFADERPSLAGFAGLLRQILAAVDGELRRRGIEPAPAPRPVVEPAEMSLPAQPRPVAADERARAYELLEQAARMLLQTDPHSPAPYLVQRAIEWGRLSTSELYQELFIRKGGQLNIFELLGLEAPQAPAE